MSYQKGPWEIDEWGNLVDANEHIISMSGISMPTCRPDPNGPARDNKFLVVNAPSLNDVVGKVIGVMDNPYSTDGERVNDLYDLLEEMRLAHVK